MSRLVNEDFNRITEFFSNYSLIEIMDNQKFIKDMSSIHKKLYSLMVFSSELVVQNEDTNAFQETTIAYIKETVSDYILALFCWVHGAYKPSNLQLRSSIENFLKSILYESNPDIIMEKSVYKIFNTGKESNVFKNEIGEKYFNHLSNCYSNLCQIAHGEVNSLSEIDALKLFPTYDDKKSKEFLNSFSIIIESVLAMSYFIYYDSVYNMHEFNLELFLEGIKSEHKREIMEYKMHGNI